MLEVIEEMEKMKYKVNREMKYSIFKDGKIVHVKHMSYFAYACKTEGKNGISRLISETA